MILDLSDPARTREVTQWEPALDPPAGVQYQLHHPIVAGETAYMGWWNYGVLLADISTPEQPRIIGHLGGWAPAQGGHTHTALPLLQRKLLVLTDEAAGVPGEETRKFIRVVNMQDPGALTLESICPVPDGDFGRNGVRFGPHNVHENRPGSFTSERVIFATYFGAGLRVYDISNAAHPREIAHFVPDPDERGYVPINDIFVDEKGLIYLTDRRDGNLYIVEMT